MSEMDIENEAETEDFTDELSDEALDREQGGGKNSARTCSSSPIPNCGCAVPDR